MNRERTLKGIYIIFFLLYTISTPILSQEKPKFHIPDSLNNYSYEELFSKFFENVVNSESTKLYSTTYLNKAKNEKDTLRIANGYSQFVNLDDITTSIKYYDSIIQITQNKNYYEYPGFGYLWKGHSLFFIGKYDDALKNFIVAQKHAKKVNNSEQLITIKQEIGSLKYFWGNKDEAIECFKQVIKRIDLPNIPENYKVIKNEACRYLSYSFAQKKEFDSAHFYAEKYLNSPHKYRKKLSTQISYSEMIAEIKFHQNDFIRTIEILEDIRKNDTVLLTTNDFNFNFTYGIALNKLNKKEEAFYYLLKADSIFTATNDLMPETRKVKEFFIDYYKGKNNVQKQLLYINQLLEVDSLINENTKTLGRKIQKEYDEPQLVAEKEKIIKNLSEKSTKNNYIIHFLSFGGILGSIAFLFYYKKQKKRFNKFTTEQNQTKTKSSKKENSSIESIPSEVVEQIRLKLIEFENRELFLENKLTLVKLAKQLNTNSSYLSKSVNYFKGKNFSTYISDLRINYCIQKLKSNEIFRKYSVKAIATEVGFNNAESFSKAFYLKTKNYPSDFIKNLNKK